MRLRPVVVLLVLVSSLVGLTGQASAVSSSSPHFTVSLSSGDFGFPNLTTEFSQVSTFSFDLLLAGPLEAGASYDNRSILDVEYSVRGRLDETPSGFPSFALIRSRGGREGSISFDDWVTQGSRLAFEISQSANLLDGVQLSELVTNESTGAIFELDAREKARLDVARYHPPQLLLYPDGTGLLWNSNNSSGDTGTINPGSRETIDLDFGDEYITRIRFDPESITIIDAPGAVVPEPGTAVLLGLGLLAMGLRRERPRVDRSSPKRLLIM